MDVFNLDVEPRTIEVGLKGVVYSMIHPDDCPLGIKHALECASKDAQVESMQSAVNLLFLGEAPDVTHMSGPEVGKLMNFFVGLMNPEVPSET